MYAIRSYYACINGSEGWNKINFHRPDLVLTEITLPGMDGFRLISHISEHFPEMKVIVMSSRSVINAFEYLKVARTYGIEFSILKPFRDEYLKLVVNRLMNSDNRLAGVG